MTEAEEMMISLLEEIDADLSSMNRVLKQIKSKFSHIRRLQMLNVSSFQPLLDFFSISTSKEVSETDDFDYCLDNTLQSVSMHSVVNGSSCFELGDCVKPEANFSGSLPCFEFDVSQFPDIFREEFSLIEEVYYCIKNSSGVCYDDVEVRFGSVEGKKLLIVLQLLVRKNFVKETDGVYVVK